MTDTLQDENSLIRKQREEIVLLTNELGKQEAQINSLFNENIKIKSILSKLQKKCDEFEIKNKNLENDLKKRIENETKEIDALKGKLNTKECLLSKNSIKLKQCELSNQKLSHDIENYSNTIKELKEENVKLNLKVNEQAKRVREFRSKHDEVVECLNSKTSLLDTATDQIQILEQNVKQFIHIYNKLKPIENHHHEISINTDSQYTQTDNLVVLAENQNEKRNFTKFYNEPNDPIHYIDLVHRVLSSTSDLQLSTLLKSLKDHWLESNVICEQIKCILTFKYNDFIKNENLLKIQKTNNEILIERLSTSTPVKHFYIYESSDVGVS